MGEFLARSEHRARTAGKAASLGSAKDGRGKKKEKGKLVKSVNRAVEHVLVALPNLRIPFFFFHNPPRSDAIKSRRSLAAGIDALGGV